MYTINNQLWQCNTNTNGFVSFKRYNKTDRKQILVGH